VPLVHTKSSVMALKMFSGRLLILATVIAADRGNSDDDAVADFHVGAKGSFIRRKRAEPQHELLPERSQQQLPDSQAASETSGLIGTGGAEAPKIVVDDVQQSPAKTGESVSEESPHDHAQSKAIDSSALDASTSEEVQREKNNKEQAPKVLDVVQKTSTKDVLPTGWEIAWSSKHGRYYYFNRETGENTWTKPGSQSREVASGTPSPGGKPINKLDDDDGDDGGGGGSPMDTEDFPVNYWEWELPHPVSPKEMLDVGLFSSKDSKGEKDDAHNKDKPDPKKSRHLSTDVVLDDQ